MLTSYGKVPGAWWPLGSEGLPRRPLCALDAEQLLSEDFNLAGNPSAYPTSSNSRQLRAPRNHSTSTIRCAYLRQSWLVWAAR